MINFDLLGKPILPDSLQLRIPYMGSKRKIAKELMQKMIEVKPKAKYFYDLFSGGGAMSFYALQCGLKVHYNEKQKGMVDLLEYILNRAKNGEKGQYGLFPDDFYNFITKEEFFDLIDKDTIKAQFSRICYSFGNKQKTYAYGKDIENYKHLAHNIVMFRCEKSLDEFNKTFNKNFVLSNAKTWNERRLDYMRQFSREQKRNEDDQIQNLESLQSLEKFNYFSHQEKMESMQRINQLEIIGDRKIKELEHFERVQNLQNLQSLQSLQRLESLPSFTITNLDFADVKIITPPEETIIYLDPPYRGTAEYVEKFDYTRVDEYFKQSPYTCFMSEYTAPFQSILEIKKESMFNNTNVEKRKYVIEKLFWNEK